MKNPFRKIKNIISDYRRDSHTIELEYGIIITEKCGNITLEVPQEHKNKAVTVIRKSIAAVVDSLRIETEDKMKIIILAEMLVSAHKIQNNKDYE